MALTSRCLGCGCRTQGSRCPTCRQHHELAHGRNTAAWQRLRAMVRARDGHRCTYCGATADLTVDLDPRLGGNHRVATIDDCRTACRSCNSSRHALAAAPTAGRPTVF